MVVAQAIYFMNINYLKSDRCLRDYLKSLNFDELFKNGEYVYLPIKTKGYYQEISIDERIDHIRLTFWGKRKDLRFGHVTDNELYLYPSDKNYQYIKSKLKMEIHYKKLNKLK
jgi:hypothetical protein